MGQRWLCTVYVSSWRYVFVPLVLVFLIVKGGRGGRHAPLAPPSPLFWLGLQEVEGVKTALVTFDSPYILSALYYSGIVKIKVAKLVCGNFFLLNLVY